MLFSLQCVDINKLNTVLYFASLSLVMSSENKVNVNILCKEVKNKITEERAQLHVGMYVLLLELDKYGKKE